LIKKGLANYLRVSNHLLENFFNLANLTVEFLLLMWLSSQKLSSSNCLANLKDDFLDLKGF